VTAGRPADRKAWHRPTVLLPVLLVLSLAGGLFPSFSLAATLYVLVLGGALCWLGLSGRVPKREAPRRLSPAAAWWLLPVLAAALLELTDFLLGSTRSHPSVSGLMDPVLAGYLPRCLGYAAWLSAFWGLVRR
jgi:hypothetical protein